MKIASIDIGSNTVLLLIAETDSAGIKKTILNRYKMPRISKGLTKENNISDKKVKELFDILQGYKNLIFENQCDKTILTATAGFRKASNSNEITEAVKKKFGFEIKTINGKTEARYSFWGASSNIQGNINRLVIDIGGGSTELIYGNNKEIIFSESFPYGTVNLTEKFITNFPVKEKELVLLKSKIISVFEKTVNKIPVNVKTIAVAGTPTTLLCINMNLKEYDEKLVENSVLSIRAIKKILNRLKPMLPTEILTEFGEIVKGRNDVILTGCIILEVIMELLKIEEVCCSGKGIRYGAIINYLKEVKKH